MESGVRKQVIPLQITPLDNWIAVKTGAMDARSLHAYQLEKLRETIDYAKKNSRFYSSHLVGIEPEHIISFNDIAAVPFTTAEMISNAPLDFLCVPPGGINRIVTFPTSGTTGEPKRVFFTKEDQELTIDFFHHGMSTFADVNDKVMIFLPCESEGGVGDLLGRGLERIGCRSEKYGPIKDYSDAMKAMSSRECTCVVGLPAQMFALSRISKGIRLKSALLCSDYVSEAAVSAFESAWGCAVFGHYGMIESGLGGGVECSARAGYHMREADLLFEVIDPASGAQVKDGGEGELVFTTLTRCGMPIIRYKTDDISRVIIEPCPCGSGLRRFERVSGRLCDIIEMGDFKLSLPMLDEILFSVPGLIGFSAEVMSGAAKDGLVLNIFTLDSTKVMCEVRERIMGDGNIGMAAKCGVFEIGLLQGGAEVLSYGNTKRRIIDKRIRTSDSKINRGRRSGGSLKNNGKAG